MKTGRGRDRRIIAVLFGTMFAAVADNQIISPLLPDIIDALRIGPERAGLLVSVYALAAAATSILLGPLSDRWGRKTLLVYGLAVFAIATALCGMAWSFFSLLAFRALTGAAAGALSLGITAFVGDYFPYERRGAAMGLVMSGYFAALIIGVPLGAFIASATSWRAAFLIFAVVAAMMWFPQWRIIPVLPGSGMPSRSLVYFFSDYRRFLRQRDPVITVIASFLISASTVGFITYVGTWLRDTYDLPTDRIGLIFLVTGIAALIGSPVAGRLSDMLGKRAVVVGSSVVMAACLVVIPRVTFSLPVVFTVFLVTGIAGAFRQAPLQALITALVSDEERGAFIALKNTCAEIGIGVGTAFSGLLYSGWGYTAVGISSASMTIAAALMLGLGVREPEK